MIALALATPARADDLVDVALLEARQTAAGELGEPTPEPDWGAWDLSNSAPAGEEGAPEVPVEPEPVPEERYYPEEPQYHGEYQPEHPVEQLSSDLSVTDTPNAVEAPTVEIESPAPIVQTPPPATGTQQAPAPPTPPLSTVPPPDPSPVATPTASSAPVIFVWIWNWTWNWSSDPRYQNSDHQYHYVTPIAPSDLESILREVGVEIPVQVVTDTGSDITQGIGQIPTAPVEPIDGSASDAAATPPAQVVPTAPRERVDRGGAEQNRKRIAAHRPAASPDAGAPLLPTAVPTQATPDRARKSAPRARAKSLRAPRRPLSFPSERVASSSGAAGGSAGIFLKTFAVLIASLLLGGLGRGRRLRLPSPRWRGLLGSRTDPFG